MIRLPLIASKFARCAAAIAMTIPMLASCGDGSPTHARDDRGTRVDGTSARAAPAARYAANVVGHWQSVVAISSEAGRSPSETLAPLLPPPVGAAAPAIGAASTPESKEAAAIQQLLAKKQFDQAVERAAALAKAFPESPVGYNLQGAAYLGKGDLANARASYGKALRVRGDDLPATLNLAEIAVREKDYAGARARYQALLAKDPKNPFAVLGMARLEVLANNEKAAREWLQRAKADDPAALQPRFLLAMLDLGAGDFAKASSEARAILRANPDNVAALELLGRAQMAALEYSDAVGTYKKLAELLPRSPVPLFFLGLAQAGADNIQAGEESLKKALQIQPNYADALNALGNLYLGAGRYAEAFAISQKMQKLESRSPLGKMLEGDILMRQRRFPQAVAAYESAFALQQTSVTVAKLHGARTRAGNAKEADAAVDKWLKEHPGDTFVRQYVAAEDFKAGRMREASAQYETVLKYDPRNVGALNNLANVYLKLGDKRARDFAEKAFEVAPESPAVRDTLGWILVEQGDVARGLPLLRDASAKAPGNPEIQFHTAVALMRSGDRAKARRTLELLLATKQEFPQREAAQELLKNL